MSEKQNNITGNGISYDKLMSEMPKVTNFAGCVIHVRPCEDWEGEDFGFDWMRIGDSKIAGDIEYTENMGRQWSKKKGITDVEGNPNVFDASFKKDVEMYKKLEKEYFPNPIIIDFLQKKIKDNASPEERIKEEAKFKYHVPVMTLRKGKKAKLSLIVLYDKDKKKDLPIKIKAFTSDPTKLKLNNDEPVIIDAKRKEGRFNIELSCSDTFIVEQYLYFIATYNNPDGSEREEYCGFTCILPNNIVRKVKVVFVNLTFFNSSGNKVEGNLTTNEMNEIEKILNQAMIDLDYKIINYDVPDFTSKPNPKPNEANIILEIEPRYTNDAILNYANIILKQRSTKGYFIDSSGLWRPVFGDDFGIYAHPNFWKDYAYHIPIVALGYKCEDTITEGDTTKTTKKHGVTSDLSKKIELVNSKTTIDLNTEAILLFEQRDLQTTAHELLHAMGLLHTFSSKSDSDSNKLEDFTYKPKKTDNILDYSHMSNIKRISTFHWQWKALWKYIRNIEKKQKEEEKKKKEEDDKKLEEIVAKLDKTDPVDHLENIINIKPIQ